MEGSFFNLSVDGEPWRSGPVIYLADPLDGEMACASCSRGKEAQAEVRVRSGDLLFSPIDHNPKYEAIESDESKRCDCMLHSRSRKTIVFVELKDRKTGGKRASRIRRQAIRQLRCTIEMFKRIEPTIDALSDSVHLACVANKKSSYGVEFATSSRKREFYYAGETRGFNLSINNVIDLGAVA